jgi:hypothetical protein
VKVLFSPQVNEKDTLTYEFDGDKIIATFNGEVDEFDFTGMTSDGVALSYGKDPSIVSDLPIQPVIDAVRVNGELKVTLLSLIKVNATEEEKFPEWIEV